MDFKKDIPEFTKDGHYRTDVDLRSFADTIDRYINDHGLQLNPDFQRGNVWKKAQQIAFVEYVLRGGITNEIRLNHPGWMGTFEGDFVCVDGLQRITALMLFLNNKIPAFGHKFKEFTGVPRGSIGIRINNLKTRAEVLKWYIDLNTGGTVHTKKEIDRVKDLLSKE